MGMDIMEDNLSARLAEVEAREKAVQKRERALGAAGVKQNLYARMNLSSRTVDAVIIACAVAIVSLVIVGSVMDGPARADGGEDGAVAQGVMIQVAE